jgi:hypothetical protein
MLEFATIVGVTPEALAALTALVTASAAESAAIAKKIVSKVVVDDVAAPRAAKATKVKVRRVKSADGKRTAAAAFRELILAGNLTDDEIFAAVQKELGIADKCRSHVSFYKSKMRKAGLIK